VRTIINKHHSNTDVTGVSYYPFICFAYHNGMSCPMIKNFKGVPVHVMKAYRCVEA